MKTNELSYEEFLNFLKEEKNMLCGCCEPIDYTQEYSLEYLYEHCEKCPECGTLTLDGDSLFGCAYSPKQCATCHSCPCDGSC